MHHQSRSCFPKCCGTPRALVGRLGGGDRRRIERRDVERLGGHRVGRGRKRLLEWVVDTVIHFSGMGRGRGWIDLLERRLLRLRSRDRRWRGVAKLKIWARAH